MALASCIEDLKANIAANCTSPIVGGYTGRALLFPLDKNPIFTVSGTNPRIVTAVTLPGSEKWIGVDNVDATDPFTGSTTQSNGDAGRILNTKTFSFHIPQRGAITSKEIVEPLQHSALGFVAILEKKDRKGDGSFEVVGFQQGLKCNPDGMVRTEGENGGDIVVTMSCTELYFECTLFDSDYATTKALFDTYMVNTI